MSDLDFERIDLDPEMEEVRYEQKPDFAQVVFHNIAEMYPTDAHVVCEYMITAPLVATSRDWVGLYKVGWSCPRDFVFFLWSPIPKNYKAGSDAVNRVVFQAHCLPKDDGEFYQFCYVTSQGCVRGASTPFQFKRPSAEDYVEVEDGDIMMIKTRTAALEDNLSEAMTEKSKLEKQLKILEKERDSLLEKLVAYKKQSSLEKAERDSMTQQLADAMDRVTQLEREADGLNKVHLSLREKLNVLNQEKTATEKRIEEKDEYISSLQEKIKILISEKDALTGKTKSLEQEKELFKNHFTTSESTMQKYLVTIDEQKRALAEASEANESLRGEVEELTLQVDTERKHTDAMTVGLEKDKACMEEAEERLRHAEDKLRASDEMVNMMKKETLAQIQVITKMSTDLEETKSEAYSLKLAVSKQEKDHKGEKKGWLDEKAELQANIKAQEKEIEHLWKKVEALSAQAKDAESQKSTDEGSLFALQTAQNHLKDRYTTMKEQHEQAVKQNELLNKKLKHHQQMESDLRHEVTDLKERLSMGADEYKVKYLEARKLEAEIRKLNKIVKRSNSAQSSRASSESKQTETECLQRSDAGTGTPKRTTSEIGMVTLKRATSEMGTATPQRTTSETGTLTLQRTTSEAGTSAAAATAEASTSSGIMSSDACTATPFRQTTEASTSAAAETAEASTSSFVRMSDAETSSNVSTADMGTHTRQQTSEVGTTTKTNERNQTEMAAYSDVGETFEITDLDDVKDVSVGSGASCPEVTQGLLDDLLQEVASKKAKLLKYKQLYHDEKEKIGFLQKHYYAELEKKDGEISALQSSLTEETLALQTRIISLEDMLDRARSNNRSQSTEHRSGRLSPTVPITPPPVAPSIFSPYRPTLQMPPPFQTQPIPMTPPLFPLSHANQLTFIPPQPPPPNTPVCLNPPTCPYPDQFPAQPPPPPNPAFPRPYPPFNSLFCGSYPFPNFPPIRYGNPYQREMAPTVRYPRQQQHTVLNIPETPTSQSEAEDENNNRSSGFYGNNTLGCPGNVSSTSESSPQVIGVEDEASAAGATAPNLDDLHIHDDLEVLVPGPVELPAPIQPEVLPTAKMAAIKHANQEQLQGLNMFLGDSILSSDDDEGPPQILDPAEFDEERFHDADGEPQKLCPACNMTFPADFPQHMFEAHVDGHYGPICPMCNEQFEQGLSDEDFVNHVDTHFTD